MCTCVCNDTAGQQVWLVPPAMLYWCWYSYVCVCTQCWMAIYGNRRWIWLCRDKRCRFITMETMMYYCDTSILVRVC